MRASATTLAPELTARELEGLIDLLRRAALRGAHVEIGTAAGGTLKAMMQVYAAADRPRFVAVDTFTYFPDQRAVVERNLRSAGLDPAAVDFRAVNSDEAYLAAQTRSERYSFIFIDADHNADHVMRDLRWTGLLDEGGYVCLHDHSAAFPGVVWATRRFLRRNPHFRRVALVDSLAILQKTSSGTGGEVSTVDLALSSVVRPFQRLRKSLEKRWRRIQAKGTTK